jgi:DedD protein
MNLTIKRRTIGVLILLIVFAWIGIVIYRQHLKTVLPKELLIPQAPTVPEHVLKEIGTLQNKPMTRSENTASLTEPVVTSPPAAAASTVNKNKIHTFSPVKLPAAWVVQLATFSNKKNAESLLSKIRHQGYDAYSRDIIVKGKSLTKVFVGPNISYNDVEQAKRVLDARYHLHGVIQAYHPNSVL